MADQKRIAALGVELPEDVEREVLSFMKDGLGMMRVFTAGMLRDGILDLMERQGFDLSALPNNWERRIVDTLLRRERSAGRVEVCVPSSGPHVMWRYVNTARK